MLVLIVYYSSVSNRNRWLTSILVRRIGLRVLRIAINRRVVPSPRCYSHEFVRTPATWPQ